MAIESLIGQLRRNWGWFTVRGIAAMLFGVLAVAWPGLTLVVLTLVWGTYALTDGIFELIGAVRMKERGQPIWPMVLAGTAGITVGLMAFARPAMPAMVLLIYIAAWAIVTGISQMFAAIQFRKAIDNEWPLVLSGVLSVTFGLMLLFSPSAGALAVAWTIGMYAILLGALLVGLGFQFRRLEPDDRLRVGRHVGV